MSHERTSINEKINQSGYAPGGLIKEVAPVEKNLLHGDPPFISSCRVEAMPAR
jgi:hypothetical protein